MRPKIAVSCRWNLLLLAAKSSEPAGSYRAAVAGSKYGAGAAVGAATGESSSGKRVGTGAAPDVGGSSTKEGGPEGGLEGSWLGSVSSPKTSMGVVEIGLCVGKVGGGGICSSPPSPSSSFRAGSPVAESAGVVGVYSVGLPGGTSPDWGCKSKSKPPAGPGVEGVKGSSRGRCRGGWSSSSSPISSSSDITSSMLRLLARLRSKNLVTPRDFNSKTDFRASAMSPTKVSAAWRKSGRTWWGAHRSNWLPCDNQY